MPDLSKLAASGRITIEASPEAVYDFISDVTHMGQLSLVCKRCWWDEGAGPRVGAWFTGHNVTPTHEVDTRCEIVAAERPREFTWIVGGRAEGAARWGYTFKPAGSGTEVEESWAMQRITPRLQDADEERVQAMATRTRSNIELSLATLKGIMESRSV
jgi:hypothetical protein